MTRKVMAVAVVVGISLFGWWVFDIPIGYYQFMRVCQKEGGLRTYAKVAPNVGWWAKNQVGAQGIVVHYPNVQFARFRSDDGTWKDVRYLGGIGAFSKYDVAPADQSKVPRYRESLEIVHVRNATRLRKEVLTILDEYDGKAAFQSTRFIFTWTNPDTTLLGQSGTVECPTYQDEYAAIKSFIKSAER